MQKLPDVLITEIAGFLSGNDIRALCDLSVYTHKLKNELFYFRLTPEASSLYAKGKIKPNAKKISLKFNNDDSLLCIHNGILIATKNEINLWNVYELKIYNCDSLSFIKNIRPSILQKLVICDCDELNYVIKVDGLDLFVSEGCTYYSNGGDITNISRYKYKESIYRKVSSSVYIDEYGKKHESKLKILLSEFRG